MLENIVFCSTQMGQLGFLGESLKGGHVRYFFWQFNAVHDAEVRRYVEQVLIHLFNESTDEIQLLSGPLTGFMIITSRFIPEHVGQDFVNRLAHWVVNEAIKARGLHREEQEALDEAS